MLASIAAQNASLDNDYGATAGVNSPASFQLALFDGDPTLGGTELAATGGYARVTVTNDGTNWPAASGGEKRSAQVTFPTSTGAWSAVATYAGLYAADGVTLWDVGELMDEISVDATGVVVRVRASIFFEEDV